MTKHRNTPEGPVDVQEQDVLATQEQLPRLEPSAFDRVATWDASYRSMLDHPQHPLHHLKEA